MASVAQDVRHALRSLAGAPLSTVLVLLLMGLGVGLTLAVYTFLQAALVRPLPFDHAEEIVFLSEAHPHRGSGATLRPANFLDVKSSNDCFAAVTGQFGIRAELDTRDGLELLEGALVLEDYFRVFATQPAAGRLLGPADFTPDYEKAFDWSSATGHNAVVSDAFAKSHFGGAKKAIGDTMVLNGVLIHVVGVLRPTFQGLGGSPAVWLPWVLSPEERANRETHVFYGVARLKAGFSLSEAKSQMNVLYRALEAQYPSENSGWTVSLEPLRDVILGKGKLAVVALQLAAGVVLLIACVNIAAILGARVADRETEIRTRRALGASSLRILRQLLTESLLLSVAGTGVALTIVAISMKVLARIHLPTTIPFSLEPRLDAGLLVPAALLSLATGIGFGLGSALGAAPVEPRARLRTGAEQRRSRDLLIVAQVALSMVLLSAGGLLVDGLLALGRADLGFEPDSLVSITVYRPRKYEGESAQRNLQRRLLDEVRATPGITNAAVTLYPPLSPVHMNLRFDIEGRAGESTDRFNAGAVVVSSDYFRTLGATLVRGRFFDARDRPTSPGSVVIDETLARQYWPGEDAVGRRLFFPYPDFDGDWFTVIGVVRDITYSRLAVEPERTLYLSQSQTSTYFEDMNLLARVTGGLGPAYAVLRDRIHEIDPDIVLGEPALMPEVARASLSGPRQETLLLMVFATTALLMAASGLYGLLAENTSRRTREIGLRIALGATPRDLARLLTRRAAFATLAGVGLGSAATFLAVRSLDPLFPGISPGAPLAYFLAASLLLVTGLLAGYSPTRRASRLEPSVALRHD